jgi:hypothetical protein
MSASCRTDRSGAGTHIPGGEAVKANLTRLTVAVSLLATMALSLAAGLKWN